MRGLASLKLIVALMALPAAAPYGDRALQPVALLLDVGMAATVTPADQRQTPLHAVTGELIEPGGRLITGGQSARFLFLPDSNIYEFSPVARSYPAPARALNAKRTLAAPRRDGGFRRRHPPRQQGFSRSGFAEIY
jgi:hypothetical protein